MLDIAASFYFYISAFSHMGNKEMGKEMDNNKMSKDNSNKNNHNDMNNMIISSISRASSKMWTYYSIYKNKNMNLLNKNEHIH
ncbi:uncharacterized protein RNJ42_01169 [Nakaseomyces bracarensis]|uniref:uncharacterized protein n=1 Tax=Nakaseomyces bracarensis TaxID=273131 RepID=UPI00387238B9